MDGKRRWTTPPSSPDILSMPSTEHVATNKKPTIPWSRSRNFWQEDHNDVIPRPPQIIQVVIPLKSNNHPDLPKVKTVVQRQCVAAKLFIKKHLVNKRMAQIELEHDPTRWRQSPDTQRCGAQKALRSKPSMQSTMKRKINYDGQSLQTKRAALPLQDTTSFIRKHCSRAVWRVLLHGATWCKKQMVRQPHAQQSTHALLGLSRKWRLHTFLHAPFLAHLTAQLVSSSWCQHLQERSPSEKLDQKSCHPHLCLSHSCTGHLLVTLFSDTC